MHCPSPGSFSNFVEEHFLDHLLGVGEWQAPTSLYAALGTGPSDTGFTEISGKGYKRLKISFASLTTDVNGFSSVKNNSCLRFGPASEDWSAINTLGVFDAVVDGNFITWGPLLTNWTVKEDEILVLGAGQIEAGINAFSALSRWTQYLQEKTLTHVYLGETFSPPPMYAAIMHDEPLFDVENDELDEPADTAYSRPLIDEWNAAVQSGPGPGDEATSSNNSGGEFGTATEDWIAAGEDQIGLAFCDTANRDATFPTGNVLMFCHTSISQFIYAGETVCISATTKYIKVGLK